MDAELLRLIREEARDLEHAPAIRETTVSHPNLPDSEVVGVRFSAEQMSQLRAAAEAAGADIESVVWAAVVRALRE